eukprot:141924-Chlamydomonas_euryale.AAC.7
MRGTVDANRTPCRTVHANGTVNASRTLCCTAHTNMMIRANKTTCAPCQQDHPCQQVDVWSMPPRP